MEFCSDADWNSNVIEFVDVPIENAKPTKNSLQTELLQYQIEYTKRDIYHRELAILEKERELSLSAAERNILLENTNRSFDERKS